MYIFLDVIYIVWNEKKIKIKKSTQSSQCPVCIIFNMATGLHAVGLICEYNSIGVQIVRVF